MKKSFLLIATLLFAFFIKAAEVDTVVIRSKSMNKDIKCVVIKPSLIQDKTRPVPVVYLLHGYSGWYSNWLIRVPELKEYADRYELMIVCPDGMNNWYFDSPVDASVRYETHVSKEVPEYIESNYFVIKDRKARAITGLSMGGHGGLFLGLRHADFFGACGSMSGAVDLSSLKSKYDIMKLIGDTTIQAENWKTHSVMSLVDQYPKDTVAMIIDCGTSDFLYNENHALHEKLVRLKIPHDYIERPGKHDWPYWRNAIQYQLLYFSNYFNSRK